MEPDQAPYSRTAAFGEGIYGRPSMTASLLGDTQRQNTQVPSGFVPQSVLHQIYPSPDGMSEKDAERRLIGGGMLPTDNGMSAATNEESRLIVSKYANV